jgi:hypothetical protein
MSASSVAITNDIGGAVLRDTRIGVAEAPALQNRTVNQAGGIPLTTEFRALASVLIQLQDQNGIVVLFPGTGITVATTAVNNFSNVNFFWRERVFEPAEGNF